MVESIDKYSYTIEHINKNDSFCFLITLRFNGGRNEKTELKMPESFGPLTGYEKCISVISVNGSNVNWSLDGANLVFSHPQFQQIEVIYELRNFPNLVQSDGIQKIMSLFYPRIDERNFVMFGNSLFLYPNPDKPIEVTLDFISLVDFRDRIYSSFGKGNYFTFTCNRSGDLLDSLFFGSVTNIPEKLIDKSGNIIYYIMQGSVHLDNEALKQSALKIISGLREFWGEKTAPPFLIRLGFDPLTDTEGKPISYHLGSALKNALTIYASADIKLIEFQKLLFHEMMHCWIGVKLRATNKEIEDYQYLWFTEGFTEYFTYKAMYRSTLLSTADYQQVINEEFLGWLNKSPYKNISNKEICESFDSDEFLMQLPYKRGFVFALFLDLKIKSESDHKYGLIDFVKEITRYYEKSDLVIDDNFTFFSKTCSHYIGEEFDILFKSYIEQGKSIDFSSANDLPYLHFSDDSDMVKITASSEDVKLLMI